MSKSPFKVGDEVICIEKYHPDDIIGQVIEVKEILEKPLWCNDFRSTDGMIHLFDNFKKFTFNKDMKGFLDE